MLADTHKLATSLIAGNKNNHLSRVQVNSQASIIMFREKIYFTKVLKRVKYIYPLH